MEKTKIVLALSVLGLVSSILAIEGYTLRPYSNKNTVGFVHPYFKSQADLFSQNQTSAQHQVRVGDDLVVDIWTTNMQRDSLQVTMSVAKFVMYSTMIHLESRDLFEWTDKVIKFWPAWGQNGKENITIGQLFSNSACVPVFPRIQLSDFAIGGPTTNLRLALETAAPTSAPNPGLNNTNPVDGCRIGQDYGYSPIAIGFIWNFLVSFIDPLGRDGVTYVQNEIVPLLSHQLDSDDQPIEFYFGMTPDSPLNARVVSRVPGQSFSHADPDYFKLIGLALTPGTVQFEGLFNPYEMAANDALVNNPYTRGFVLPAAWLYTNANSLCHLARVFSKFGLVDFGHLFATPGAIFRDTKTVFNGEDFTTFQTRTYAQSGMFKSNSEFQIGSENAFGHDGLGGSLVFTDINRLLTFSLLTSVNSDTPDYQQISPINKLLVDNINRLL